MTENNKWRSDCLSALAFIFTLKPIAGIGPNSPQLFPNISSEVLVVRAFCSAELFSLVAATAISITCQNAPGVFASTSTILIVPDAVFCIAGRNPVFYSFL